MSETLSILYVGEMTKGSTGWQRFRALEQLGHKVRPIDTAAPPRNSSRVLSVCSRINGKLFNMRLPHFRIIDLAGVNEAILNHVRSAPVDLLWLGKALAVRARTLREVKNIRPSCLILGYSPDDMAARHNQSDDFLEGLPLYDFYFTTKTYGVAELRALGCPRAHFVPNAYDPDTHRPIPVTADEKRALGGEVGFVGTFEAERGRSIRFLAARGMPVRIYGNGWKLQPVNGSPRVEGKAVYGQDYAKVLCAFDINLCFLRRLNRDRQTQRSVEIPACGAFMLAERSDEHVTLFEEGVEAEFFSSDEELLDKARYYLAHPEQRKRIAEAGRRRCLRDGYSYHDRLKWILRKATEVQP
jgi:spore maturation protein CgeB